LFVLAAYSKNKGEFTGAYTTKALKADSLMTYSDLNGELIIQFQPGIGSNVLPQTAMSPIIFIWPKKFLKELLNNLASQDTKGPFLPPKLVLDTFAIGQAVPNYAALRKLPVGTIIKYKGMQGAFLLFNGPEGILIEPLEQGTAMHLKADDLVWPAADNPFRILAFGGMELSSQDKADLAKQDVMTQGGYGSHLVQASFPSKCP
jgi:hypothetical protein